MTLDCEPRPRLPSLAWCLRVDGAAARLVHGPGVETGPGFFVEGAWAGPFEGGGFDESFSLTGSGGVVRGETLVLAAPCHTTECLYSLAGARGERFFSNSLPFLLLDAGDALDPAFLDYEATVMSISWGIDRYVREMPARSGRAIGIHYFCNLEVSAAGTRETPKPEAPRFRSFADYESFLREQTRAVVANAASPARRKRYAPLVFASNGYDSTACAVLARAAGCVRGVAFESKKKARVDSGLAILRTLGFEEVFQFDELDYKAIDCADLFAAGGELGTSVFFAAAARQLEGGLLFSGVHGDKVWEKSNPDPNALVRRSVYPDTARREFRLVTGYLNFPVPFLGVTRHADLHAISNSEEMRPWSVGGDYDRPIPRRIAEEGGVPRRLFALTKSGGCATTFRIGNAAIMRRNMPPASFARFAAELPRLNAARPWSLARLRRVARYGLHFAGVAAEGLWPESSAWLKPDDTPLVYACSPFAPSFLQLWAVESVQRRYYSAAAPAGAER